MHNAEGKVVNIFSDKNNTSKYFYDHIRSLGFDAVNSRGTNGAQVKSESPLIYYLKRFLQKKLHINYVLRINYSKIIEHYYVKDDKRERCISHHYTQF